MGITIGENPVVDVITKKFGNLEVDIWKVRNKPLVNGPPVAMIHGMFGGGWYFEDWARFLCEKGLVVYVIKDLHFQKDVRKVSFYDYVRKIESETLIQDFCRNYSFKPIFLGHSMGGLIVQEIAQKHPWLVSGIILVASAPPKGISTMSWDVAKAMAKHFLAISLNLPLKIDKKSALNLLFNWLGDEERKEQLFQKLVPESSKIAKQLAFSRISVDERKAVCKTLVVAGTYDKLLPLETQIEIAQKYNADYRSFLNGHMMMLEDYRDEIISVIYNWIDTNFVH